MLGYVYAMQPTFEDQLGINSQEDPCQQGAVHTWRLSDLRNHSPRVSFRACFGHWAKNACPAARWG